MNVKNSQIRSVLMGGIGNQLFQYSFGCMIANKYGCDVSLDLRGLPTRGQQKGSSILELQIKYRSAKKGNRAVNYFWKLLILRSIRSSPTPFSDFFLGVSSDIEFSINKLRDFSVANLFLSTTAIEHFQGELPLSLSAEPSNALNTEYSLVSDGDTVAIHHRLGDSVRLRESRGLLGPEYFRNAISRVKETGSVGRIRVYSDEPDYSKKLLSSWLSEYQISWASPGFSAAEVLTAMARARHLVLSNSTMSWWAAAGGIHETVVAPTAWNVSGSNHLNLGHWKLSDPDWT